MDSKFRCLMRSRNRLYRKFKKNQYVTDGDNYKRTWNQVVSQIRLAKEDLAMKTDVALCTGIRANKTWWKICKEAIGEKKENLGDPLL